MKERVLLHKKSSAVSRFPLFLLTIFAFISFSMNSSAQTVVDVIANSTDHETLEDAVIAAELDDDLSGAGPFTVFAPTDDAFNALGAQTLNDLLADPTGDLATILQYHVTTGSVQAGDLSDGQIVSMLEGTSAFISLTGEGNYINQAEITSTDIAASNGVVHVMDA